MQESPFGNAHSLLEVRVEQMTHICRDDSGVRQKNVMARYNTLSQKKTPDNELNLRL
jgi:hypothetical protein